jgi:cobalt-zinc-cadmium efflux system outer membrane protein
LTLSDAFTLALRHNPSLAASAWGIHSAQSIRRDAGKWLNPDLGIEVENFGGDLGTEAIETTVALGQTFQLGGDRGARAALADGQIQLAGSEFSVEQLEILRSTTESFLEAWASQERLERFRVAERTAREAVDAAERRVRAGASHPLDRVRAEANVAARASERRLVEAEVTASRQALALSWGMTEATFDSLVLDLPDLEPLPPPENLIARLDRHPERLRRSAEVRVTEAQVRAARAARIPDVEAIAGVRHLGEVDGTGFVAAVGLPLPIWNSQGGGLASAQAELAAAEARNRVISQRLEQEFLSAYARLGAAMDSYTQIHDELLPSTQEALELLGVGYRAGRFSYLDYLEGQRSALEAEMFSLEATRNVWSARMALERLLGNLINTEALPQEER